MYRGYKVLKVYEDGSARLSSNLRVDAETGKVHPPGKRVKMPRKRKFPNTRFFGGVTDYVEGNINAITEMHMRGELADKPGGGVTRIANRWVPGPVDIPRRKKRPPTKKIPKAKYPKKRQDV